MFSVDVTLEWFYSKRPLGTEFRLVNPAEKWRDDPAMDKALTGFTLSIIDMDFVYR